MRACVGIVTTLGLAVVLILAAGCREPLFPGDAQRSPYERYQTLRGEEVDDQQAGGRPIRRTDEQVLRQRLRPLDQR